MVLHSLLLFLSSILPPLPFLLALVFFPFPQQLKTLLYEPALKDVVVLVFANKTDQPNAMSKEEISERYRKKFRVTFINANTFADLHIFCSN